MDGQANLQNKKKNIVLLIQKAVLWICILLWMGVIFLFSSQNGAESAELSRGFLRTCLLWILPEHVSGDTVDVLEFIVRKAAHMTEYAILGILISLQMRIYDVPRLERKKIGLAVFLVFLYASTDEFHQLFVGGRSGQIRDVFIDTAGGFIGVMLVMLIHKVRGKRIKRIKEKRE